MRHRVWSALCTAARWYVASLGAALCALGNAELGYLQRQAHQHDIDAYARARVLEIEAWLGRHTVRD